MKPSLSLSATAYLADALDPISCLAAQKSQVTQQASEMLHQSKLTFPILTTQPALSSNEPKDPTTDWDANDTASPEVPPSAEPNPNPAVSQGEGRNIATASTSSIGQPGSILQQGPTITTVRERMLERFLADGLLHSSQLELAKSQLHALETQFIDSLAIVTTPAKQGDTVANPLHILAPTEPDVLELACRFSQLLVAWLPCSLFEHFRPGTALVLSESYRRVVENTPAAMLTAISLLKIVAESALNLDMSSFAFATTDPSVGALGNPYRVLHGALTSAQDGSLLDIIETAFSDLIHRPLAAFAPSDTPYIFDQYAVPASRILHSTAREASDQTDLGSWRALAEKSSKQQGGRRHHFLQGPFVIQPEQASRGAPQKSVITTGSAHEVPPIKEDSLSSQVPVVTSHPESSQTPVDPNETTPWNLGNMQVMITPNMSARLRKLRREAFTVRGTNDEYLPQHLVLPFLPREEGSTLPLLSDQIAAQVQAMGVTKPSSGSEGDRPRKTVRFSNFTEVYSVPAASADGGLRKLRRTVRQRLTLKRQVRGFFNNQRLQLCKSLQFVAEQILGRLLAHNSGPLSSTSKGRTNALATLQTKSAALRDRLALLEEHLSGLDEEDYIFGESDELMSSVWQRLLDLKDPDIVWLSNHWSVRDAQIESGKVSQQAAQRFVTKKLEDLEVLLSEAEAEYDEVQSEHHASDSLVRHARLGSTQSLSGIDLAERVLSTLDLDSNTEFEGHDDSDESDDSNDINNFYDEFSSDDDEIRNDTLDWLRSWSGSHLEKQ